MKCSRDNSLSRRSGEGSDNTRDTRERSREGSPSLRVIEPTKGSVPSPDQELASELTKLVSPRDQRVTDKDRLTVPSENRPPRRTKRGDIFPEASDDSDRSRPPSRLNDVEQHFQFDKTVARLERIEIEREGFVLDIRMLQSQEYTTAMNMIGTSMYVAKRIHDLVEFGKVRYANEPDLLESFRGKPLDFAVHTATELDEAEGQGPAHQKKLRRWAEHYASSQKLTERASMFKTNYDLAVHLLGDALLGPIDAHNYKRAFLKKRFNDHNTENEMYNEEHPHLHANFKRDLFDYTHEEDSKKRLTPEIPHLPSLEEALEKKIWVKYLQMRDTWKPTRPDISTEHLDWMFSLGTFQWEWNRYDGRYETNLKFDPPDGPPPNRS